MNYNKIENRGLGICHILKINHIGYLMYIEKNQQHFVICQTIEDNRFYNTDYFNSIDEALSFFNRMEEIYDKEN